MYLLIFHSQDTQVFLNDIDKENEKSGKRMNLVDRQLRLRLVDEVLVDTIIWH